MLALEIFTTEGDRFLKLSDTLLTVLDVMRTLIDALLRKLNLKTLEFDLLREVIVLTVILDIIELLLVSLDIFLGVLDLTLFGRDCLHLTLVILFEVLEACL